MEMAMNYQDNINRNPEKQQNISPAVIRRLPRYYRYLSELMLHNINRISSAELSRRMHLCPISAVF